MKSSFGPMMRPIRGAVVVSVVGSFMVAGPRGGLIVPLLWAQPAVVVALFSLVPCLAAPCFHPMSSCSRRGLGVLCGWW
jgi:hypothetical protein